mmetsp:Transcript_70604/g.113815  ORF Transcript_70604/g.113815 Transcript_70604/m.113815 type:complete len:266 (+) Transcript_70604:660-1457(+)
MPQRLALFETVEHVLHLVILQEALVELPERLRKFRIPVKWPDTGRRGDPNVAAQFCVSQAHSLMGHLLHVGVVRMGWHLDAVVAHCHTRIRRRPASDLELAALLSNCLHCKGVVRLAVRHPRGCLEVSSALHLGPDGFLSLNLSLCRFVASTFQGLRQRPAAHQIGHGLIMLANGLGGRLRYIRRLRPVYPIKGVVLFHGNGGNLGPVFQQARSLKVPLRHGSAFTGGLSEDALLAPVANEGAGPLTWPKLLVVRIIAELGRHVV